MDQYENLILRWLCLFDEFGDIKYSDIKSLISSASFRNFVDNVFDLKCYIPSITEDEKLYNIIKVNYQEYEVQKYNDLYDTENSVYTCVIVLVHTLLHCTNSKFRGQLSERMDDEEQVLLANFLEASQHSLFTKKNISEALLLIIDKKHLNSSSEIFSNNTPVKSKSSRRSYLQEFYESPKSQFLIYQEKDKLIAKLTEDYKNECEENFKLTENIKIVQDLNTKLSNKLEDKNKIIQCLKDEIEEFSIPKESLYCNKVDNTLIITKLNQDILDLEMNNSELKLQITELENKHKDLNGKFEKKSSDYDILVVTFDNIEAEMISLKTEVDLFKEMIQKKDIEITSLKDELNNKSISNTPMNSSCQETINVASSNTLYDELNCVKLEEVTHDKEKYRHKYKSTKKDLINAEHRMKDLDDQLSILKQKIYSCETHNDELNKKLSCKKKELQDCLKKNNNLESKIKNLKDCIKDKDNHIKSISTKLDIKENQIKEFSVEIDTIMKSKNMIELILTKTNTEIETLHEENEKSVKHLQTIIEDYKKSEELLHENITNLENDIKKMKDDLTLKNSIINTNEQNIATNHQTIINQEEQIKTMYKDNIMLESCIKDTKTENEKQFKEFNDKIRDMENCLEYYLDEIKDIKNNNSKMEEILNCKKNEMDKQTELINFQKNIIETLESTKCCQEINIKEINVLLQQKSTENISLKDKIQESSLNLNILKEQLNALINEKTMLEKNLKTSEDLMNKSNEELQCQIYDMKNVIESQTNEIKQYKFDLDKIKDAFDKKQNDFNNQLVLNNKQIETISNLRLEKYDLEDKLKSNNQCLFNKNNEIKSLEDMYFQSKLEIKILTNEINLKISENCILVKNLDLISSTTKNMLIDYDKHFVNVEMNLKLYDDKIKIQTEKILKLTNYLHVKENEIEIQIDLNNKQSEYIIALETEKRDLLEKINNLNQCLLNKDAEIINLEKKIHDYNSSVVELKEQLGVMKIEKVIIETNLHESLEQYKNSHDQFTEQNNNVLIKLRNCEEEIVQFKKQHLIVENMLENKQKELDKQLKLTVEQNEIIKNMISEKAILENEIINASVYSVTTQVEINSLNDNLNENRSFVLRLEKELDFMEMEKKSVETKLKDIINQKEVIKQEFDEQITQMNDCLKDHTQKNNHLQNCLTDLTNDLNKKQIQIEDITKQNNKLNETINNTKNMCINFEDKLKNLSDSIIIKDENIMKLELENANYSTINNDLKKQFIEVKQILNENHVELDNKIQLCIDQKNTIDKLNCENESFYNQIQNIENILSHKEYEFNLCEGKLYDCSNTINNLEKELNEIKKEKSSLELKVNETIEQLSQDLNLKLEFKDKEILKIQEKLIFVQNELEKQIEQSNDHLKTISFLNIEKDTLLKDVNMFKECLKDKEYTLSTLQKNNLVYIKQYEELKSLKIDLESEFNKKEMELVNEHQELNQKLICMESKYDEIQKEFKIKQIELDDYIDKYNCHMEKFVVLTSERDNLINETNSLKNNLLIKDNLIASNQLKFLEYEEQNDEMKTKYVTLEIELKQTNKLNKELQITHEVLTQNLERIEKELSSLQKDLSFERLNLEKNIKKTENQLEIISTLTSDKNNLTNEINVLKGHLLDKENILSSNNIKLRNLEMQIEEQQTHKVCLESNINKLQDYNKKSKEIECHNKILMLELSQLKDQLSNLKQESIGQINEMNKTLCETQKQLDLKHIEIEQKNNSLTDIYQKINDLKNMKNKLELFIKDNMTIFETFIESYSSNYINKKPIEYHHQDSLMEVITSADTFIEQNGIHLGRVENCDDYSIIERLKKLFEALKMFIININTQGREIKYTNNENATSKETYSELLAKSNTQLETIKHLESEMAKLKAECNYKMTKVQQKTQEYVTSEYEKKFERKREQMKQFCKDVESKIHQDYEAKLMKYKEKIKKDEIHIKEIGQQLWEISEKYLKLQQKERRESTMSLPYEIATVSYTTTNLPKYNSFTLPKSSSASQIKSLVEEPAHSNQDNSKRNIPAGIGKKFSLSSGKIFPKVEDEDGEMFNHSCLADLKQGKVRLHDNDKNFNERLSELQARNSLCPPHLRSCYAVETNFLPNTSLITEECIKTANYSDCESENLIPNERKKKDRNQTSYKKPGPPTPSKNGGRASLSGNAKIPLKEPKETNGNKRRASNTPNKLFSLFMSKKN